MNVNFDKLICTVIFCLAAALPVLGERTFSGKVVDREAQTPVEGAAVVLLSLPDSIYCGGISSDAHGRFAITTENESTDFLIDVSCLGFTPVTQNATDGENIVLLDVNSNSLNEVTVKGFRSSIKTIPGGFSFDPKQYLSIATDALNLITKTPFIESGIDGNITGIKGKEGIKIYINGKDPNMPNDQIMQLLRAMEPKMIKSVELWLEPGAKFKASDQSGIININLSQPFEGLLGAVSVSPQFLPNLAAHIHGALSYAKGNFNTSAYLMLASDHLKWEDESRYRYFDTGLEVENRQKSRAHSERMWLHWSTGYNFTKRSRLESIIQLQGETNHSTENMSSVYTDAAGVRITHLGTIQNRMPLAWPRFTGKVAYSYATDSKGSEIMIKASYFNQGSNENKDILNFDGDITRRNTSDNGYSADASAEYDWTVSEKVNLSAGYDFGYDKWADSKTDPLNDIFYRTKTFSHGIFANVQARICPTLNLTAGIRAENRNRTLSLFGSEPQDIKIHQWDWSPNLSVNWKINDMNMLQLGGRRQVIWPSSDDMVPVKWWKNENTYQYGNTALRPYTAYNAQLYYTFRNNYGAVVSGRYIDNWNEQILRPGDDPDTMMEIHQMMDGHLANINAEIFASALLCSGRWYTSNSISYTYAHGNAYSQNYSRRFANSSVSFSTFHQVTLWPAQHLTINASFSISSPSATFAGSDNRWIPDLYFRLNKRFEAGYISLSVYNIIQNRTANEIVMPTYSLYRKRGFSGLNISASFSYYFGNMRVRRNSMVQDANNL